MINKQINKLKEIKIFQRETTIPEDIVEVYDYFIPSADPGTLRKLDSSSFEEIEKSM